MGKIQRNTGLDELPHFFNVVREQMSLVGPRPIVEEQKKEYGRKYLEKRGSVKPGITGYWQVNDKSGVNYRESLAGEFLRELAASDRN